MHAERFYTLAASCPDRVGIIARVSGFIAEHQGWILESSYHADPGALADEGSRYFMRIEVKADGDKVCEAIAVFVETFPTERGAGARDHAKCIADKIRALDVGDDE